MLKRCRQWGQTTLTVPGGMADMSVDLAYPHSGHVMVMKFMAMDCRDVIWSPINQTYTTLTGPSQPEIQDGYMTRGLLVLTLSQEGIAAP